MNVSAKHFSGKRRIKILRGPNRKFGPPKTKSKKILFPRFLLFSTLSNKGRTKNSPFTPLKQINSVQFVFSYSLFVKTYSPPNCKQFGGDPWGGQSQAIGPLRKRKRKGKLLAICLFTSPPKIAWGALFPPASNLRLGAGGKIGVWFCGEVATKIYSIYREKRFEIV